MSARKIAYNTMVQIVGKIAGFFISAFSIVILTEHLGTVGMGYYTTVTAFVGFFLILAELGFNTVMVREIAQNWADRVRLTGEFFGLRLVFSLIVFGLAVPIAWLVPPYRPLVASGVALYAATQFLLLTNQFFVAILQLNLRMDFAVLGETVNRLITLGLYILAARVLAEPTGFFFAALVITALAAAVNLLLSFLFAVRFWPIRLAIVPHRWRALAILVWPMTAFSFLGVVHFKADTVILSLLKPAYDVGIYGYSYKIVEIMFTLPLMFLGVVFPRLSELAAANGAAFRTLAQKTFDALALGTVPFIAGIWLTAPYLTVLLSRHSLGDGLLAAASLRILTLAMFAWFFGALYQHMLLATKHYAGLIRNIAIVAAANIVLNVIFIPHYSYLAAATTTVMTEGSMLVLSIVYVRQTLGFRARWRNGLAIGAATLFMAAVVWAVEQWLPVNRFAVASRLVQLGELIVLTGAGTLAYGATLLAAGRSSPLLPTLSLLRPS